MTIPHTPHTCPTYYHCCQHCKQAGGCEPTAARHPNQQVTRQCGNRTTCQPPHTILCCSLCWCQSNPGCWPSSIIPKMLPSEADPCDCPAVPLNTHEHTLPTAALNDVHGQTNQHYRWTITHPDAYRTCKLASWTHQNSTHTSTLPTYTAGQLPAMHSAINTAEPRSCEN